MAKNHCCGGTQGIGQDRPAESKFW